MQLVIVESPTKAKTINRILGKDYIVKSSMGHLIDLPKSQLGVDTDQDFEVKYITIRGKGKILAELRRLAKKADIVYLATDPDREGEAISWHLMNDFQLDTNSPCRVVFNEITKSAVKKAFDKPRQLNHTLVEAQQARRVLDRLVGYKISPILWHKVKKGLSAGRVQSVTLAMICAREQEIEKFVPREYWSMAAVFGQGNSVIESKLTRLRGEKPELANKDQVDTVLDSIRQQDFIVSEVESKPRHKNPQSPFTTSTLQQEAGKKLGFSARKTMVVAQQLYEGISLGKRAATGLITYMRTDSVRISEDFQAKTAEFISEQYGSDYVPESPRAYTTRKGAQEAHEAIRPTDLGLSPKELEASLKHEQMALYSLIWQRYLASQMSSARFMQHTVSISGGEILFKASAQELIFPGHLRVSNYVQDQAAFSVSDFSTGEAVKIMELIPKQHFTEPLPRYSEALLVKDLENYGIGRPSTYAPVIETLVQRNYIERKDGKIFASELGKMVNVQLLKFFPDILNVQFTARLEKQLDEIADGEHEWKAVVRDFYRGFKVSVEVAEQEMELLEVKDEVSSEVCNLCGRQMVIKAGRFGKFLACPGYPDCKNTKPFFKATGVNCPQCGSDIVQLRSRRGRTFYGCKSYPDCDFRSWKQPLAQKCPDCNSMMVVAKKDLLGCSNTECTYTEAREDNANS